MEKKSDQAQPITIYATIGSDEPDSSTPMLADEEGMDQPPKEIPQQPSSFDIQDVAWKAFAEFYGTLLFVMFGCSAVCGGAILKLEVGVWQVAIVWGLALALAIYLTVGISGGHLNPAVTIAMAVFRRNQFPLPLVLPYISAQFVGAFFAGILTWAIYDPFIERFENRHNLTRGESGSYLSAAVFGGYYPNPGRFPLSDYETEALVTTARAFTVEALGTMILVLVIFVLTSTEHRALGNKKLGVPFMIGLTLAVLICEYGVITECSLNPARDLGPRLAAAITGWGKIAFPGPRNGFWIYLVAPIAGALVGGVTAECLFIKALAYNNKKSDGIKTE